MAVTLESLGIDRLSVDERISLVEDIRDTIVADAKQLPLTEVQRAELERRLADDDANPDDTIPWEQVEAKALARFRARRLSPQQEAEIRTWLNERHEEEWDAEIEDDVRSGRLDAMAEKALAEHRGGQTRPL